MEFNQFITDLDVEVKDNTFLTSSYDDNIIPQNKTNLDFLIMQQSTDSAELVTTDSNIVYLPDEKLTFDSIDRKESSFVKWCDECNLVLEVGESKHMQLLIDASNDEENWDKQRKEHEIKGVNIARKGITAKVSFMIAILRAHTPGKEVLLEAQDFKEFLWKRIYFPKMCKLPATHEWSWEQQTQTYGQLYSKMHGQAWCRFASTTIAYGVSGLIFITLLN